MKRFFAPMLLIAIFSLILPAQARKMKTSKPKIEVGKTMLPAAVKPFKLKNATGKDKVLGDLIGTKGTAIIFTCNSCPYAKAWEERITKLGNKYHGKEIAFVLINSNSAKKRREGKESLAAMKKRADRLGLKSPYLMDTTDSAVANAFGAGKTPEVFLFDKNQKLFYYGAVDNDAEGEMRANKRKPYLDNAIMALKKGKKSISPNHTKAIGCGIKFGEQVTGPRA